LKKTRYEFLFLFVFFLVSTGLPLKAFGARPSFKSYEIKSELKGILYFDFDGDGLDDIITIDDPNLAFFFQDSKRGFAKDPDLVCLLSDKPAIFWHAKFGNSGGQKILVMTADGVSTLTYVDKSSPPVRKQIISWKTVIPEKCEDFPVVFFGLSADTGEDYPLIFVPTEDGLEIFKYDKKWQHAGSLQGIPDTKIWGPRSTVGYTKENWLNMNIADLNGDGLEDLVICESKSPNVLFRVYPQIEGGLFASKPSQTYEYQWHWHTWICLEDINRDGKVDVIKNKWLDEPWLLPGTRSGKVLVQIFMSDAEGDFSDKPAFVFRKNDWQSVMPILDIDGDGFMDLVLGYNRYVDSEKIRKTLISKKLEHSLRFHFYDDRGFPKESDCQKTLVVHINQRGLYLDWGQRRFLERQICLDGDFDGDGDKDLLVKDKGDKASVYFFISKKKGFSKKANMHFKIKQVKSFITEDLNNDGISDLMVFSAKNDSFKVFLSKKRK